MSRRRSIVAVTAALAASLSLTSVSRADGSPSALSAAPLPAASAATTGLASYVVLLREPAAPARGGTVLDLARSLVSTLGGDLSLTYDSALHGFAARLPSAAVAALRSDPRVLAVSPDTEVTTAETQRAPIWNLDRSDQAQSNLDGRYRYPRQAGAGAHVYVVDTGLSAHPEIAGRIGAGRNFVGGLLFGPDPARWADCDGHGTHVASTAAGTQWGIAKRATVHAVRVLDCRGAGSTSEVLAGLDWVAANHQSPAVVNMSLSNQARTPALDAAVAGLVQRGVAVAVAAGNSNRDACRSSPGGSPAVLTVGATTRSDARASFSNFGPCVDLFAPGVDIIGARTGGPGGVAFSGTSMSAPHVAGALALVRGQSPGLSAAQAHQRVLAAATSGKVADRGAGSPDRLLRVFADRPPKARFSVRCDGLRCLLSARASDDEGVRGYRWRVGGQRSRGATITHVFGRAGRKSAVLTVVDASGQSDTARRSFTVRR